MGRSKKTDYFLKECMADALLLLMEKQDFKKITVDQIARTAGVNRSTWFRNYQTKDQALTYKLVRLWYRWAAERGTEPCHVYTEENAADFFRFNYEYRDLVRKLLRGGHQTAVYQAFYEVMSPQLDADPEACYEARFYANGLFGLLLEWHRRDFRESPETMTDLFQKIMAK